MTKKIYFEPAGRIHSTQWELINYPPKGYEFIVTKTPTIVSSDFFFFKARRFLEWLMPLNLTKARLEGLLKKKPQNTDLTYAYNHVIFREEPWVVFVEWVHALIGRNTKHLPKYKKVIEKTLTSDYCKSIITWCEKVKESILLNLDCTMFEHKMEIVPIAVHPKNFVKDYANEKVKLLFVDSADTPYGFIPKGGIETLEAFTLLCRRYDNLELVIRSRVPSYIKDKCQKFPNIKLIENIIPWEQLEQEFKSADIFVQPTHNTPFGAFLQAMSYELPVITRDADLNSEVVEDGVTGFCIKSSKEVPYFWNNRSFHLIPTGATPYRHELDKAIQTLDTKVVEGLAEKISILIENPALRRKMGKAARREIEEGEHSIKQRNEKLKEIFDKATREYE